MKGSFWSLGIDGVFIVKKLAASSILIFLVSCATPKVIEEVEIGDNNLSCSQLEAEFRYAQHMEESARSERGITSTNVAATLFFLPGLAATYINTDEAIDAAQDRQDHLMRLMNAKGC